MDLEQPLTSADELGLGASLVLFVFLTALGILAVGKSGKDDARNLFLMRLFVIAFFLRFLASLAIYQVGFINTLKDEDGSGWVIGIAMKEDWTQQGRSILDLPMMIQEAFVGENRGYWHLLGWLFFFTGLDGRMPAATLNCFFGAMTVVLAYRSARILLPERAAVWVGWCSCLFPSLIIWSAQTIKEPMVIFLESIVLYACLRLRETILSPKYLLVCFSAIVMLLPFRFYAAYASGIAVVIGLALSGNRVRASGIVTAILLAAVMLAMFGGFLKAERTLRYTDVRYIERFRRYAAKEQGSANYVAVDLKSSAGVGEAIVFGGVHLLFAPFPWQWSGIRATAVAPEVIFWWWICWRYIWPGIRHVVRYRLADFAPLLIFLVLMGLLYSMMFSNVGLAYRHRAQLTPWLLIIAAAGREITARTRGRGAINTPANETSVRSQVPSHSAERR